MSCFHPAMILKRFDKRTGLMSSKFYSSANVELLRDKYSGNFDPDKIHYDFGDMLTSAGELGQYVVIPCGKCIGCRMDYSRSWADRMTYHSFGKEDSSYFLTLTYDDYYMDSLDHSSEYDLYALNYDHLADFIKKLRNYYNHRGFKDIDFFASGEYGDSSFRPHFHLIVYGIDITDLKFFKLNDTGDCIYTSDLIEKFWQKGYCTISKFGWQQAAYCASYVTKKLDGRKLCEYTAVGLTPEKMRCSRRPGIAYDYYMLHGKDIWDNNGLSVDRSIQSSGHLGIPRYFRKLAERHYKDDYGNHVRLPDQDAYEAWKLRSVDKQNILNPLKLDNSSFDLDRVDKLLEFEEREILLHHHTKKL